MKTKRILILLLATSLLIGCAKIKVARVPPNTQTPPNGVIYALPNTVVRVQAKVDKTEKTGAPYQIFAAIFAPGKKTVCKDDDECTATKKKIEYALQEGATFLTYGEPDPANVFLVKFTGGRAIDQKLSMTWNEAGLLSAASAEVTNRTVEVALAGAKLATSLGAKAVLGADKVAVDQPTCKMPTDKDRWVIDVLWTKGPPVLKDTLVKNYCAIDWEKRSKFVEAYKDLLIEATDDYSAQLADLIGARKRIIEATGTPAFDPVGMLTRIDSEIDERLKTLYLGSKKAAASWEGLLDVRTIADGTMLPILRIDAEKGICPGNSEVPPVSKPIPSDFLLRNPECSDATAVNLTLSYYPEKHKQLFTKMEKDDEIGDRSFRYRIPAQMRATLYDKAKTYGVGTFQVAQLGAVISLPATRQSKTLSYDLTFIEATGALKTFKLGTAGGLDASTLDSLSGIGGTLLDARSAARKKEDELTVLTRQYQLLKLRDDICTLQKKNGLECTVEPE